MIRKEEKESRLIKCEICGDEFHPYSSSAKYCSDKCRKIAHAKLAKQWAKEHREEINEKQRKWRKDHPKANREKRRLADRRRYWEKKKKMKDCQAEHDNCFSCTTPDGDCLFS